MINFDDFFNILFYFFIFFLGVSVGSFLNVLIDRLALEEKITGRSRCDYCRRKLSLFDLIPIVSFFLLRGKCRYCGKKISWQYPLVEMITGISFFLITKFQTLPQSGIPLWGTNSKLLGSWLLSNWNLFGYWLLVIGIFSCLIVIFFQDLKYQIISDWLQVFFFIFVLFYQIITNQITPLRWFFDGLVVMLPIFFLHIITQGRGMGFGDVKLSFTIGFLLGIKGGLMALYLAFILGGIVGILLILFGRKKLKSKIAFGPFLVLGIVIMFFWEKEVFQLMSGIYGF